MEKNGIRKSLKNNFLKNLVFRLDFSNMMEKDVEDFIQVIREKIYTCGYTTLKEVYDNNTNVNLDVLNPNNVQINNETQKVYQFTSSNNKVLKISKSYIVFDINMELNETLFSTYLPLISEIINELKKRKYVHYNRIGLRKTNVCILLDKSKLNDYFTSNVLYLFNENSVITQIGDEIFQDNLRIHFNRRLQTGTINVDGKDRNAFQIVLDIDAYMQDDFNINVNNEVIEKNSEIILTELNTSIFNIYVNSLTDDFISKLQESNFDDINILGVTKNV